MAKRNWRQFRLLLWKNWLLQKKQVIRTVLIVLYPIFVCSVLVVMRQIAKITFNKADLTFRSFSVIPSLAAYPILQADSIIAHIPDTPLVARILNRAATIMGIDFLQSRGFASETELEDYMMTNDKVFGAIVFMVPDDADSLPKNITYKIRLRSDKWYSESDNKYDNDNHDYGRVVNFWRTIDWRTDTIFPDLTSPGPRERSDNYGGLDPGYFYEGFLAIQKVIDLSLIVEVNPNFNPDTVFTELQRYPFPSHYEDELSYILRSVFPLFILISFVVIAPTICQEIVLEKENKFKELMKMMGMHTWLYWSSWFIKYLLFMLTSVIAMTILLHAPISTNGAVILKTSPIITFVFLLLYTLTIITFCFMLSTLINKARNAVAIGGIFFPLSYSLYFYLATVYNRMTLAGKLAASLDFNVAMGLACFKICQYEARGIGANWNNIWSSENADDDLMLGHILIMLFVDSIIYSSLIWYFDAVMQGDYGNSQPFYFPFTREYWIGRKGATAELSSDDFITLVSESRAPFFETPLQDDRAGIRIRGLTKNFGSKTKPAVNNLNIDFNEGNITALLGHNGAGKTTTMFMLTGLLPPTKGTAFINGLDITRDMDKIRQNLGLCPQHDILFDSLTVREHLIFYATLKGSSDKIVFWEMVDMIKVLHMEEKIDDPVESLSGGQKRKLSVGIALISGSKFLILDEPTSGMDPESRRQIWDILQSERKGRTMILSTHYMDEADLVGDRIAIMSNGEIECYGTPMFLKNKYGVGYHLTITKTSICDVDRLSGLIKSEIPMAHMVNDEAEEIVFALPSQEASKFEALFESLETNGTTLGVISFGVSVTTMEDVFLSVKTSSTRKGGPRMNIAADAKILGNTPQAGVSYAEETGWKRQTLQLRALLFKRFIHSIRYYVLTLGQILIPVICTVLACATRLDRKSDNYFSPLVLDLTHFKNPITPYSVESGQSGNTETLSNCYETSVSRHSKDVYMDSDIEDYLVGIGEDYPAQYNWNYQIGATITESEFNVGQMEIVGLFNGQTYHALAISLSYLGNTLMQCFGNKEYHIKTINHPLPRDPSKLVLDTISPANSADMTFTFPISFGMAFLFATFLIFLVKERKSGAKHSQLVSGVRLHNFWLATFLWDYANYLVPCFLIVVVILGFRTDGYWQCSWIIFISLMLYGFSMLPFTYVMSFLSGEPSVGFLWLASTCIVTGIFATIIIFVLQELTPRETWQTVEWIFCALFPPYCFNLVLKNIYKNWKNLKICYQLARKDSLTDFCEKPSHPCCRGQCKDDCIEFTEDYMSWEFPGVGRLFAFMVLQGIAFFILLYVIETNAVEFLMRKITTNRVNRAIVNRIGREGDGKISEDSDVVQERQRIQSTPIEELVKTNPVVTQDLTKLYGNFVAVNQLSIGVSQKECFGLLGVNGAGKTTTFKTLTGEIRPSFGRAYITGINVQEDLAQVHQKIGYCSQSDSIIDQMTVHETLWMYACAHGIPPHVMEQVIDRLENSLTLKPYTEVQAGNLSGGNKRKLCVAVALMGNPTVVFLDEPTTGVDPESRRHVWNTLAAARNAGTTIILTSHSMEECAAICTRLGILVNGRFLCLGSLQYLRDKFSEGYTLIIKLQRASVIEEPEELHTRIDRLKTFISQTFPQSDLKDQHENLLNYQVKTRNFKWSNIFRIMEKAKVTYQIEDYSVGQTTLEQLFIGFARLQRGLQKNIGESDFQSIDGHSAFLMTDLKAFPNHETVDEVPAILQ